MKQFLCSILCTTFLASASLQAGQMPLPDIDPIELLNSIDPAELEEMLRVLEELPPETLEELRKEGERYFESFGYDVDAMKKGEMPTPAAPKPAPEQPKPTSSKPAQEIPSGPSRKEKDSLTFMVQELIGALTSIRQKATADEVLAPLIAPLIQELDLLAAYLNRFTYDKHLKHFEDKEFAPLKTKLSRLTSLLLDIDDRLEIPEYGPSRKKRQPGESRRQQLKRAESTLNQFVATMNDMFKANTLLTDIENLFKKYDQEALTIKKQVEEQAKKAQEGMKRVAGTVTNIRDFSPTPNYGGPRAPQQQAGPRGGYGSHGGGAPSSQQPYRPTPPPAPNMPQAQGGQKGQQPGAKPGEKKDAKSAGTKSGEEKKDEKPQEMQLSPIDKLNGVKQDLVNVERLFSQNKRDIDRLIDLVKADDDTATVPGDALTTLQMLINKYDKAAKAVDQFLKKEVGSNDDDDTSANNANFMKKNIREHYNSLSTLKKTSEDLTAIKAKLDAGRNALKSTSELNDWGNTISGLVKLQEIMSKVSKNLSSRF